MTPQERIDQINATLAALTPAWPTLAPLLTERAQALTLDLISQDNEQTRGRIKALRELLDLPDTLLQERAGISAGLAE